MRTLSSASWCSKAVMSTTAAWAEHSARPGTVAVGGGGWVIKSGLRPQTNQVIQRLRPGRSHAATGRRLTSIAYQMTGGALPVSRGPGPCPGDPEDAVTPPAAPRTTTASLVMGRSSIVPVAASTIRT